MIKYIIVMLTLALASCGESIGTSDLTDVIKNDPRLADCEIFTVSKNAKTLYITRCKNSTTSTTFQAGKATVHSATIDESTNADNRKAEVRTAALAKLSTEEKELLGIK